MANQTIPAGEIDHLEIKAVSGDLHLTGWNREEFRIKELDDSLQVEEQENTLQVSSAADLIIHFPHRLPVKIKTLSGDAYLRDISSEISLDSTAGDLHLRSVGSTAIKTLQGDLIAAHIKGDLRSDSIRGDALLTDIQGQVELKDVSGDLQLEKVAGGTDAAAAGNGSLDFQPVPWQAYSIKVKGDLSITMPVDADADLSIDSGAGDITLFPGKLDIKSNEKHLDHQLGEGGTSLQFSAGGKVFILDNDFTVLTGVKLNLDDLGTMTADFSSFTADHISSSLNHLEDELKESLQGLSESLKEIGLSEENLQELGAKIEESSRKVAQKAELAAIKAQAKVEKKYAKARRKAQEAAEKTKQFDINQFMKSKTQPESVSEQERILILKMLQEKKISPEEADGLLHALEGK